MSGGGGGAVKASPFEAELADMAMTLYDDYRKWRSNSVLGTKVIGGENAPLAQQAAAGRAGSAALAAAAPTLRAQVPALAATGTASNSGRLATALSRNTTAMSGTLGLAGAQGVRQQYGTYLGGLSGLVGTGQGMAGFATDLMGRAAGLDNERRKAQAQAKAAEGDATAQMAGLVAAAIGTIATAGAGAAPLMALAAGGLAGAGASSTARAFR